MGLGRWNSPSIASFSVPLPSPQSLLWTGPGPNLGHDVSQTLMLSVAVMGKTSRRLGGSQEQYHEWKDHSCSHWAEGAFLTCRESVLPPL